MFDIKVRSNEHASIIWAENGTNQDEKVMDENARASVFHTSSF